MRKSPIYILSQPIQTGKTSLLSAWCNTLDSVGGILTPDVNSKRMVYDLSAKQTYPFQLNDDEEGIRIGRFTFSEQGFTTAQTLIERSIQNSKTWTIIDEVGRLEINQQQGLEPTVSKAIAWFKQHQGEQNLLLVIRDYLLLEAIAHYQLQEAIVVDVSFFQTTLPPLLGVVLCGGQSVRMGEDKAFITYHQQPQYAHVFTMMQAYCNEVKISCNDKQKDKFNQTYTCIVDSATFENNGPLTGVLSVFEQYDNQALLVIGCDYPHFTLADMKSLVEAREPGYDVVCYYNTESEFTEPLLAIYEPSCAKLLKEFWQSGQSSLNHFLKTVRTKRITPKHLHAITSVDVK
jgi:molybdopterin-guanine dinucleotide biosynthesis protein A/nucleoside-triphosphatase THEP1